MIRRLGPREGWTTYLFLLFLYLLAVWSLNAANWADGLGLLIWVVFVAATLGLILAKVQWLPGVIAHIVGTVVGIFWTLFIVSFLLPGDLPVKERILALVSRFVAWLSVAIGQGVNADNVMFVLQLAALLWLCAYLGSWFAFRRQQVWPAVIPAGLVILINNHYAGSGLSTYFVLYLLVALLFTVRVRVSAEQLNWHDHRIAFAPDIVVDFLKDGAILSVLIVAAAVFLPSVMAQPTWKNIWNQFAGPWQDVQTEWARLYSTLRSQQQVPTGITFGRTLALGGAVNLSETPFMVVQADRAEYWRATVYDKYTGHGWISSDVHIADWAANQDWPVPSFDLTEPVTQTIRLLQPTGRQLFAAGQATWADIPVETSLSYVMMPLGSGPQSGLADISMLQAVRNIPRQGYTVVSSVSVADTLSLRTARSDYPDWVTQRYLDLPPSLPARVGDLAQEITQGASNAYDAATAIESYLRREYKYSQDIEPPPQGTDAVDYFLFTSKVGYCDYYASAMVVMLRSLGIPARVASGYASGAWDSIRQGYTVLYSDAHSWPEVFFPKYGWVPFEPTSSQPPISRPSGEETGLTVNGFVPPLLRDFQNEEKFGPDEMAGAEDVALNPEGSGAGRSTWAAAGIVLGGLLLVLLTIWGAWWAFVLRRMKPAERMFARMTRLARLAGLRRQPSETPREFAQRLAMALGGCQKDAIFFADTYNLERFRRTKEAEFDEQEARSHWTALQKHVLAYEWQRLRKRFTPKPRRPYYERIPISRL